MIYTVTLNPSLDRTVEVGELLYDDVNRITEESSRAGGKGIDVSRTVKDLGGESVALGFAGGYSGMEMEGVLLNEGLVFDFTPISGSTRLNLLVRQKRKKLQTLLSTSLPEVGPTEVVALFKKIKAIPGGSYLVMSGATPDGMDDSFCAQVITALKEKGVKVVLDADENVLKHGVKAGPYLMKPNIHELGRLVQRNLTEVDEVIECARPFLDNVEYIVVSMGPRGAVGVSRDDIFHMIPPKVKVRSSVGAGDSLVAGTVFVLHNGGTFREALHLGVACGTASTLNVGTNVCPKEDVEAIRKDVIVKKF